MSFEPARTYDLPLEPTDVVGSIVVSSDGTRRRSCARGDSGGYRRAAKHVGDRWTCYRPVMGTVDRRSDGVIEGAFASNLPAELLIDRGAIAGRVGVLGAELSELFGTGQPPVLVGILKGRRCSSRISCRAMDIDVAVDFMSISSYSARQASCASSRTSMRTFGAATS